VQRMSVRVLERRCNSGREYVLSMCPWDGRHRFTRCGVFRLHWPVSAQVGSAVGGLGAGSLPMATVTVSAPGPVTVDVFHAGPCRHHTGLVCGGHSPWPPGPTDAAAAVGRLLRFLHVLGDNSQHVGRQVSVSWRARTGASPLDDDMYSLWSSGMPTAAGQPSASHMMPAGAGALHEPSVQAVWGTGVLPHQPAAANAAWVAPNLFAFSNGCLGPASGCSPGAPLALPLQPPPPPSWDAAGMSTGTASTHCPSGDGVIVRRLPQETHATATPGASRSGPTSLPSRKRRSPHASAPAGSAQRQRHQTSLPRVDDGTSCTRGAPEAGMHVDWAQDHDAPGEAATSNVSGCASVQPSANNTQPFVQLEVRENTKVLPWVWAGPEMADALGLGTHGTLLNKFEGGVDIVIPPDLELCNSSDPSGVIRPASYDEHWQALKPYLIEKPQGWQPFPTGTEPAGAALEHNWRACLYADWVTSVGQDATWPSQSWKPTTKHKRRHLGATILYLLCRCVPKDVGGGFTFPFFTPARWKLVATVSLGRGHDIVAPVAAH
jgi:hypothetical protein